MYSDLAITPENSTAGMSAAELNRVLVEFNDTAAPFPGDCGLHQLFEAQAERTPEAVALIHEDRQYSYRELNEQANRLAHYLISVGVGAETLVGICVRRSPEMIVGMLGILKAGGAYVALDPAYPKVRQAFTIEDAACPVLLTQQELADSLPKTQAKLVCLDSDWNSIAGFSGANPGTALDQHNLAYVLYTSGSTGRPKGVAIEHRSVVAFLTWGLSVFSPEEMRGTLAATSICFDLSVFEIFLPLTMGGTVILAENALALPTLAARAEVTLVNTVPSAMAALVSVNGIPDNVQVVNLAGEPLPNKLVQDVYRSGRVKKVYNLYGPSEDTTYSTYVLTEKGSRNNPTIGRPISNTQVYIVDPELRPTPIGEMGELCLAGEGLARGYLNRPELTSERFLPNPFGPGRLYKTGDLASFLPSGEIEYVGRLDHQVKVRGFRIELGEIETALEQHSAVDKAVVLALPDKRGDKQLVAFLFANSQAVEDLAQQADTQEHVSIWQTVYEETYRQAPVEEDATLNISGWKSSYTGEQIPTEEMREWVELTVRSILDLKPRQVLEIGCGTGMLLARIAPHCELFVGLDFSPTALEHIRSMQQTIPGLDRIRLFERGADQLDDFEAQSFDAVVINSVVQHFPDVDYLLKVVQGAVRLVRPGGHVFIGDVLNLNLLESFHTSVQAYRASGELTVAKLRRAIRQQMSLEKDLQLAPEFFEVLKGHVPEIAHVQVVPKPGRSHNQLTRFRYDAILHVGQCEVDRETPAWLDWHRQKLSLEEIGRRLAADSPRSLAVASIPNARLHEESNLSAWLQEAGPEETVAQLRAYLAQQPSKGVEAEDLRELAEQAGYRVELSWLNAGAQGTLDAVFTRKDQPLRHTPFAADVPRRGLFDYANHPQRTKLNRQLIPVLRTFLQEKLPAYMTPAVFMVLDKLPLTPTGKVDRKQLEQLPVDYEPEDGEEFEADLNPLEKAISDVWSEVLNLRRIGLDDDFFSMGGNSLQALIVTTELQRRLACPLQPLAIFNTPTVGGLAGHLQAAHPDLLERLETADTGEEREEGEI
jgi:amino acid adenylation domain-containing protein